MGTQLTHICYIENICTTIILYFVLETELTDYKIEESETYGPFGIRQDALLADGTEVPG